MGPATSSSSSSDAWRTACPGAHTRLSAWPNMRSPGSERWAGAPIPAPRLPGPPGPLRFGDRARRPRRSVPGRGDKENPVAPRRSAQRRGARPQNRCGGEPGPRRSPRDGNRGRGGRSPWGPGTTSNQSSSCSDKGSESHRPCGREAGSPGTGAARKPRRRPWTGPLEHGQRPPDPSPRGSGSARSARKDFAGRAAPPDAGRVARGRAGQSSTCERRRFRTHRERPGLPGAAGTSENGTRSVNREDEHEQCRGRCRSGVTVYHAAEQIPKPTTAIAPAASQAFLEQSVPRTMLAAPAQASVT